MNDRLTQLITSQLKVQHAHDVDPLTMTGETRITYLKDMVLGAFSELNEALGEFGWKHWATSRHINEDALFGELRDCWQFLTNAMLATRQVDPAALASMLEEAIYEKHAVNHTRVRDGYDGVSLKCPACSRALDDPTTRCRTTVDPTYVMCGDDGLVRSVTSHPADDPLRCPVHDRAFTVIERSPGGQRVCEYGDQWRIVNGRFCPA